MLTFKLLFFFPTPYTVSGFNLAPIKHFLYQLS